MEEKPGWRSFFYDDARWQSSLLVASLSRCLNTSELPRMLPSKASWLAAALPILLLPMARVSRKDLLSGQTSNDAYRHKLLELKMKLST